MGNERTLAALRDHAAAWQRHRDREAKAETNGHAPPDLSREARVAALERREDVKAKRVSLRRHRDGTAPALVMDVARELPQPFTIEDLIVACWRKYPDVFGLAGIHDYPDSHKFHGLLAHGRGLVGRCADGTYGQLEQVRPKTYRVREVMAGSVTPEMFV